MQKLDTLLLHKSYYNLDEVKKFRFKFLMFFGIFMLLPFGVFVPKFIFVYEKISIYLDILLAFLPCILIYALYLLRMKGLYQLSATIITTILYISAYTLIYLVGGFSAPGYFWMGSLPLTFAVVLGKKASITGGILAVLTYISYLYFESAGIQINLIPSQEIFELEKKINIFLFTIVITFTALVFSLLSEMSFKIISNQKKDIESLLRVVTHDISNPLSVLYMRLARIQRSTDIPQKDLDSLKKSTDIISQITDSVRSLMSDSFKLEKSSLEAVDLNSSVETCISLFEEIAQKKKIKFVYNPIGKETLILGHKAIIEAQVINNLLSNAIKYSPQGSEIKLEISESSSTVVLIISDQGVGIPKENIEAIFDLKIGKSTLGVEGEKGTGFGLNIVKKFMNSFNGSIWVESSTDKDSTGTKFYLEFNKFE